MKKYILLFLVLVGAALVAPNVKADGITDALVESLRQQADASEERAAIEEARGNRVGAAQWRQTAGNLRRQAKNQETNARNIEKLTNTVGDAINKSYNNKSKSNDDD
jgi:hypothetical protein